MKSTQLSTIMFSIIIALAMMFSIQNNAFSENERDAFVPISYLSYLPYSMKQHQCFTANDFIYCAGGYSGGPFDAVWYASLNTDGTLGNWQETTSLPQFIYNHQCLTANGFVYCVGGNTDKVWYTSFNTDGTLDNWQETTSLPYSISNHQCFTANSFIYCAGGSTDKVWFASLNTDGTLGNWQKTTSLPHSLWEHQCFTANGFVYCAGGYTGIRTSNVWYANLNTDGTLGDWQKTTSLRYSITRHQCFTSNGFVYCAGGLTDNRIDSVIYASLNTDGTLGSWNFTTKLLEPVGDHQCLSTGYHTYCLGGDVDYNTQTSVISIHRNPFIIMPTHPKGFYSYNTNRFTFSLSEQVKTPYGFYYLINNTSDTQLISSNSKYTTDRSLNFASGIAVDHGSHYLHIAIANRNNLPTHTTHFRFNTYNTPILTSSPTHPDQNEWYDNSSFQIELDNKKSDMTYRYIIDDYSNTIPSSLSALVDFTKYVFVNQPLGTHYFHIQLFDKLGNQGQPLHFRYNIYDSDEPKPAPLPVVTELNVDPTSVIKDGTISIEGTIEIK